MYSAQAADQAAPESTGEDGSSTDDAVDAEFEEVKEDKT